MYENLIKDLKSFNTIILSETDDKKFRSEVFKFVEYLYHLDFLLPDFEKALVLRAKQGNEMYDYMKFVQGIFIDLFDSVLSHIKCFDNLSSHFVYLNELNSDIKKLSLDSKHLNILLKEPYNICNKFFIYLYSNNDFASVLTDLGLLGVDLIGILKLLYINAYEKYHDYEDLRMGSFESSLYVLFKFHKNFKNIDYVTSQERIEFLTKLAINGETFISEDLLRRFKIVFAYVFDYCLINSNKLSGVLVLDEHLYFKGKSLYYDDSVLISTRIPIFSVWKYALANNTLCITKDEFNKASGFADATVRCKVNGYDTFDFMCSSFIGNAKARYVKKIMNFCKKNNIKNLYNETCLKKSFFIKNGDSFYLFKKNK